MMFGFTRFSHHGWADCYLGRVGPALGVLAVVLAACTTTDAPDDDVLAILEQRDTKPAEVVEVRPPQLPAVSNPASLRAGQRLPEGWGPYAADEGAAR